MDEQDGAGDAAWAPPAPSVPGPAGLLPGYRDVEQIARGGDSIVYRAHQDALDRDVAIKVVLLDDDESIARFRRELAITVRLGRQHPNIMTVLATATTSSGQPCLVMDHVELGSLHDRLTERGPLPVSEVVAAGSVIADALAFAHTQGVLHRDVKPQNVLVLPTSWVLADFGLARAIDAGHSSSLERFSYRHASPQVLDGEPPTVADDVYSLGSTLFTLLDGRAPFASPDPDEDSALSYLRRARTETPRPLTRDDVPLQLAGIVRRCLARDPAQRFPDAAALRDALDAVPTESRSWAPEPAAPAPPLVDTPPPPVTAPAADAVFAPPPPPPPSEVQLPPVQALPDARSSPPVSPSPPPLSPSPPPLSPSPPPVSPPPPSFAPTADPPPEPERPATSALAQLPDAPRAVRPDHDADATGLRPAEPPPAPPWPSGGPEPSGRRRWPVIAAAGVLALAVGIGVGVWRASDDSTSAAPRTSGSPSTSRTASSGPSTGRPIPPVTTTPSATPTRHLVYRDDPRITSYKRGVDDTIVLAWTDPTRGTGAFVVVEKVSGSQVGRTKTDPGQTTVVVPDIPRGRHCFAVVAVTSSSSVIGPDVCRTT